MNNRIKATYSSPKALYFNNHAGINKEQLQEFQLDCL